MASVQKVIMKAVQAAAMTALTDRNYETDNVRLRRIPSIRGFAPGKKCVISPSPEKITDQATNESEDAGYGVLIALTNEGNGDESYTDSFDDLLIDRTIIRKYFHNQRVNTLLDLSDLPLGFLPTSIKVEPGPMLIAEFQRNNVDATALIVRVNIRERRLVPPIV